MKKAISLVILLAMTLSLFTGCQEPYDPDKLYTEDLPSKEVCKEIFLAFLDMGKHAYCLRSEMIYGDMSIDYDMWYYGTINGYMVILADVADTCVEARMKIAGCVFKFGTAFELYLYRDGEVVCTLKEAYEKGLLTKDHIKLLEQRHVEKWGEVFGPDAED